MRDTSQNLPSRDVVADINYFPALGTPILKSAWRTPHLNERTETTSPMLIRDIRASPKEFNLDTHGFQFISLPPKARVRREDDEETVKREYYPELEEIAKKLTGASTTHVFNHVIRAHSSPSDEGKQDAQGRWQSIPSSHAHVDYAATPGAIEGTKTELNLPSHIAHLFDTSWRFSFLGAWRPLKSVRRDPLAVCDATSVTEADYQVRLREFARTGNKSANYVMSHEGEEQRHEWWYMSEMQPDEMVVFKGYDTARDLAGWRCPHTAFRLEGSEGEEPRESIEARIVCFWE
ncbi:hypothetical protein CC86DRAFT_344076 [Ophiobolus disseminans]|uniref:GA4 desaturase family protein n=1 Tax=Ophiobolus disseminans TaxID=1469910 RepID=A0A6A7AC87_9PLEO|nr:hypothetical protein CC86DRAFT_344076 [Ophiobolus disseminans]